MRCLRNIYVAVWIHEIRIVWWLHYLLWNFLKLVVNQIWCENLILHQIRHKIFWLRIKTRFQVSKIFNVFRIEILRFSFDLSTNVNLIDLMICFNFNVFLAIFSFMSVSTTLKGKWSTSTVTTSDIRFFESNSLK